jgi:hypothetical protein
MSNPDDVPTDEKYISFKRQEFLEWLGLMSTLDLRKVEPERLYRDATTLSLDDAVVIRRQDSFASPCLLTYAAMIAMVGEHHPEPPVRAELLAIADYFQRQGELAGIGGYKLPTL